MKKIFRINVAFALLLLFSCSDDEGNVETNTFGFSFSNNFYALNQAWFEDLNVIDETPSDISLTLSNVNLGLANAISNVAKVDFTLQNLVELQPGTYEVITDYSIEIGSYFDAEGNYVTGTSVLNTETGLTASSTLVTINQVDLEDNFIDLNFQFTRNDGQVIEGIYQGTLTDNSVAPE